MKAIYEQKTYNQTNIQQLYQTLSNLLITNKKIITYFEKAFLHKYKGDLEYDNDIKRIKQLHNEQQIMIGQLSIPIPKMFEMDLARFIARIIETLGVFKHKYCEIGGYEFMIEYIREVQLIINGYFLDKNLLRILNKIIKIDDKYIARLSSLEQNPPQQKSYRSKIQKPTNESHPQYFLNKLLHGINKSYQTLNLDLDINYFRNSYLRTRNTNTSEQFQNQVIERNSFILKQINQYSKDYKDYLNRKQVRKNQIRKNRIIDGKQKRVQSISPRLDSFSIDAKSISTKKDFVRKTKLLKKSLIINENIQKKKQQELINPLFIIKKDQLNNSDNFLEPNKNISLYNIKFNKNCYEMKKIVIGNRLQFNKSFKDNKLKKQMSKLNSISKNYQIQVHQLSRNLLQKKNAQFLNCCSKKKTQQHYNNPNEVFKANQSSIHIKNSLTHQFKRMNHPRINSQLSDYLLQIQYI